MKNFTVKNDQLTVADYQALRGTTGWEKLPDAQVEKALARHLYSVTVFENEEVVGMGRIVGDGSIYFYIQDVIVHPAYQGQGVGKLIMEGIEDFLAESVTGHAFVGLMAAKDVHGFYSKLGYKARTDSAPGMFKVIQRT